MFRPGLNGPQSLILTLVVRPLAGLVTITRAPKGKFFAAAVSFREEKRSPVAVLCPSMPGPYQEASPIVSAGLGFAGTGGGVTLAIAAGGGDGGGGGAA